MCLNFDVDRIVEAIKDASGNPILILSAGRGDVSDGYGAPFYLVPPEARVLAVGRHSQLPFSLVAYLSETSNVIVAVTGPSGIYRSVSVQLWPSKGMPKTFSDTQFENKDDRAVARLDVGKWTGSSVAGIAMMSMSEAGAAER